MMIKHLSKVARWISLRNQETQNQLLQIHVSRWYGTLIQIGEDQVTGTKYSINCSPQKNTTTSLFSLPDAVFKIGECARAIIRGSQFKCSLFGSI